MRGISKYALGFTIKNKGQFLIIIFFLFFFAVNSYSQQFTGEVATPEVADDPADTEVKRTNGNHQSNGSNIDARMLYGQYNNIYSTLSIINNQKNFTYQLNSELLRSNDFGYDNSSFYEGEIAFTGKSDLSDSWKLLPQLEVKNESHGMFNRSLYSREEKDKIKFLLKNEYKPTPSRLDFTIGGAQYVHRLESSDPTGSDFYKLTEELGWEYILSASNKFGIKHQYSFYTYDSDNNESDDRFMNNELYGSFNLTEYLKIDLTLIADWNKDNEEYQGWFPSGRFSISSLGFEHTTIDFSYGYELIDFNPEDFYFQQKYIKPGYDLPPGKAHRADASWEFSFLFKSSEAVFLRQFRFKLSGYAEHNNNFYNYTLTSDPGENVITAETMDVTTFQGRGDLLLAFGVFGASVKGTLYYEYYDYTADKNVTYHPNHILGSMVEIQSERWVVEWENKLRGRVHVDPDEDSTLGGAVIGALGLQYMTHESFYLYLKMTNLYDNTYSFRDGYPEPGRAFLAGIRIKI